MERISSNCTLIWNMINEFFQCYFFNLKGRPSEQLKKKKVVDNQETFLQDRNLC